MGACKHAAVNDSTDDPTSRLTEAETKARAQELFNQSISLFTSTASKAVEVGGRRDHPLVLAAQVELERVKTIATRLGGGTVPMSEFVRLVGQINDATERLSRDMQ